MSADKRVDDLVAHLPGDVGLHADAVDARERLSLFVCRSAAVGKGENRGRGKAGAGRRGKEGRTDLARLHVGPDVVVVLPDQALGEVLATEL